MSSANFLCISDTKSDLINLNTTMFFAPLDSKTVATFLELRAAKTETKVVHNTTTSFSPLGFPATQSFLLKIAEERKEKKAQAKKTRAAAAVAAYAHHWAPKMPQETASAAAVTNPVDLVPQSTSSFFSMAIASAYVAKAKQDKAKKAAASTNQDAINKALTAASLFGASIASAARTPIRTADKDSEDAFELVEDVNAFVEVASAAKVQPHGRLSSSDSAFVVVTN